MPFSRWTAVRCEYTQLCCSTPLTTDRFAEAISGAIWNKVGSCSAFGCDADSTGSPYMLFGCMLGGHQYFAKNPLDPTEGRRFRTGTAAVDVTYL